jgi:hypothetical protein
VVDRVALGGRGGVVDGAEDVVGLVVGGQDDGEAGQQVDGLHPGHPA